MDLLQIYSQVDNHVKSGKALENRLFVIFEKWDMTSKFLW